MEASNEEREHGIESPGRQLSPSLVRESLIIFDWDDTILPTSWLERIRALTAGVPMRPEVQRQMAALSAACAQTISMASQMGTLVWITNSAPGWIDQSCQLFMPQIHQQVRSFQIFAKPMHAPLTFKINVFRRECQQFRNICSVGDGDAERAASLRLLGASERKISSYGEQFNNERCVKSVKLIEFPSCQQLIAQQEMLQTRLADIVNYQGSLDLKARFPATSFTNPLSQAKPSGCTLVHFARSAGPMIGPASAPMRLNGNAPGSAPMRTSNTASGPGRPMVDDNTKMHQGLMMLRSLPAAPFQQPGGGKGFNGSIGGQLPPLGAAMGKGGTGVIEADLASGRSVVANDKIGSGSEDTSVPLGHGGAGGSGGELGTDGHAPGTVDDVNVDRGEHGNSGERDVTPNPGAAGVWRVQGGGGARSPYQGPGKKRPVLPPGQGLGKGLRSRGPAVWAGGGASTPGVGGR